MISFNLFIGKKRHEPASLKQPGLAGRGRNLQPRTSSQLSSLKYIFALIILLFLYSGNACAEDEILETMIVTATRSPISAKKTAANITVLTREEIDNLPARNIAEALNTIPGVYIDRNGGLGSQASASIYGSETRHVSVYMDGVPLNMLANPLTDLSRIPLDNVDRIEIYKGSASSVWGSALGGVINIITRQPDYKKPVGFSAALSIGDYQTYEAAAALEGAYGDIDYLLSFKKAGSQGFDEHRNYDLSSLYFKSNVSFSERTYLTFAALFDRTDKYDPLLFAPGQWESLEVEREYQSLMLEQRFNNFFTMTFRLYNQRLNSRDDFHFDMLPEQNNFTYVENTRGASIQGVLESPFGRGNTNVLNFGLDMDWGEYNFSLLDRDVTTRNSAVRLTDTLSIGSFSLNLGARLDDNKNFGSQVSPSAGIVFNPKDLPFLLRLQYARGFSAPPLSFLFDPRSGNPDLGPETGTTWQLGVEMDLKKRFHASINLFRADIEDMIYFDPLARRLVNLDEVRRMAMELNFRVNITKGLDFSAGGSWIDVTNTRTNLDVKDIPTRIIQLRLTHAHGGLSHSLSGRYLDYNSSDKDTRDKMFIYDYKIRYAFSNGLTLNAAVHNITDQKEYHWWYLPHPGRWAEIGFSYKY